MADRKAGQRGNAILPYLRAPASFKRMLGSPRPTHDSRDKERGARNDNQHSEPVDSLAERRTNTQEQKATYRRQHAPP